MNEITEIVEPSRKTPLFGEYEVVVLGGGPAGIAAAAAAGRSGRSTILVERYGFLGGAGTAAGLSTFCGLHANLGGGLERLRGLRAPHLAVQDRILAQAYDISAYKIVADELMRDAGVTLLYHAFG